MISILLRSESIPTIDLYKYNLETYNNICEIWKRTNKASVIQATGTGKTYLMLKCIYDFYYQNVVVLAPSNYILDQLNKKANYNLPNVKLLTYTKLSFMAAEDIAKLNPSLIVLDEFHRCGAEQWGNGIQKLLDNSPNAKVLGTTATPVRFLDNERDMADELFEGEIAVNLSLAQAIVREILPMPKYISALYTFDEEVANLESKIENSHNDKENKVKLLADLRLLKKKLQKSKGIPAILNKHLQGVNGGKFVLFCKDTNHMNDIKQSVIDWFKEAKIGKEVESNSILSGESRNKKELSDFANNTKNENVRLLFTINMLNEGVHIDDVTGVILLRPTTSPIIYFQQIGRAIQAGNKQSPLIFDLVNNFSNMGSKTFKEELEKARAEEIERMESEGKSKEEINMPDFMIHDEMRDIIDVFGMIEDQLSDNWNDMFEQLEKYKIENGNCLVPTNYIIEGKKIGNWVANIRRKRYILSEDKISKLNDVGFVWNTLTDRWDRMYQELMDYRKEYGNCLVPNNYQINKKLGHWVANLRNLYSQNKLAAERISKLESIGFIWSSFDENWEICYKGLAKLYETDSNIVIPKGHLVNKINLRTWVLTQRQLFKNNKLSNEKIKKLESIGFDWEEKKERWGKSFNALCEYKEKYKNCEVPRSFKLNGINLGHWTSTQFQLYKNNELSADRIKKLESIGFKLGTDVYPELWNQMYELLINYNNEYGSFSVKKSFKADNNLNLYTWVLTQRQLYKNNKLTQERVEKLEEIGFPWEPYENAWNSMYEELKGMYNNNENYKSTRALESNGLKIGSWITNQRTNYKNNKLSQDRIDKLESIGFVWSVKN